VENALKLVVREVFEVLYSPVNAFRKIIEKPDFKGVLLILVLVISSMIVSQYIVASKLLLENRIPENDDWTESLTNQHNWVSNGSPSIDDTDYQMGNTDGNHSISSSVPTETSIWLKITDVGSINCSEETGYNELSITGIEFRLDWSSSANLTMKIDGLFFRKFSSPLITGEFSTLLPSLLIQLVMNFAMNWILWAGILILVAKLFNEDLGRWNIVFVIIGYSFIATVVYTLVSVVPLSTLPMLNVPLDADAFNALFDVSWRPLLAYQLWLYIPVIGEAWIAALGAVAVRLMKETTWGKAATIAAVAFAIRFILRLFLGF